MNIRLTSEMPLLNSRVRIKIPSINDCCRKNVFQNWKSPYVEENYFQEFKRDKKKCLQHSFFHVLQLKKWNYEPSDYDSFEGPRNKMNKNISHVNWKDDYDFLVIIFFFLFFVRPYKNCIITISTYIRLCSLCWENSIYFTYLRNSNSVNSNSIHWMTLLFAIHVEFTVLKNTINRIVHLVF